MDDTVLLSTSRQGMNVKLELLNQYCNTHKTRVNNKKTKFFVINGNENDHRPFVLEHFTVGWCDSYVYLGSTFTSDGNPSSAIKAHAAAKMSQAVKFVEFVRQNSDAPIYVKLKVFHACVTSSVLYACETWLQGDVRPVAKLYNMCVKAMLGVRNTTCNDLCYLELGIPPVKALVMAKQRHFLQTLHRERADNQEDPWNHAVSLSMDARHATGRYLHDLLTTDLDDVRIAMQQVKHTVENSQSSRRNKYVLMNPTMNVHHIYTQRNASPI